ncbi:stress-response A/B barrel domain-containing protein UP3-like [Coffea arabica]|uniref:Stress-response A/B barrel domain-containing protein UP3-like n=1 Tax=Coffea arabica TaxID=13443 RepID=A0A6P6TFM7_COFAR|nr:stress-response A/B barrel domain-containing protein UP3-like [Coffea arabica]
MLCGGVRAAVYCSTNILSFPRLRSSSSSSPSPFKFFYFPSTTRLYAAQSQPSIKMSAGNPPEFIEHIVLFKVKPDIDPSKATAVVNNLSSLASLDSVLHLTAGPVLRSRSSSLTFTHMLHSRYASKSDLDAYSAHPDHVAVVTNYVKPIVDDIMAVDWVASGAGAVNIPPGSAMRVTFLKLKEGSGEDEKNEVLGVTGGIKEKFPGIEQLSFGENFSPGRAKGFSIASVAVLNGVNELEGFDAEPEAANKQKDLVRDKLDGVVVLDYVVPPPQTASL